MRGVLVAALALALAALVTNSQAQQRTFYNSRGNIVGRSSTNSSGTTTWTVWRASTTPPESHGQHDDRQQRNDHVL